MEDWGKRFYRFLVLFSSSIRLNLIGLVWFWGLKDTVITCSCWIQISVWGLVWVRQIELDISVCLCLVEYSTVYSVGWLLGLLVQIMAVFAPS
jgi:hypothetical protein